MAVNESLSAYSTTAASNTPSGSDNIGTELDDHLRDIKRNIRRVATQRPGPSAPSDNLKGSLWLDTSGSASDISVLKISNGSQLWATMFTFNESAGTGYSPADPSSFVSTATTLTAGTGISGGGTLAASRSFSLANFTTQISATATWTLGGGSFTTDPYGRVISASSGHSPATAAEMEDRSSTAVYVTPAYAHQHLGTAKFWVAFDGSGTASVTQSYNVSSVVRSATGIYTVNFSTGFANTGYSPVTSVIDHANGRHAYIAAKATGSCQIVTRNSADVVADTGAVNVVGFGYHAT
jgi:hypothetical protein